LKWPPTSVQLVRGDQTRGRRASINTHESTLCGRKSANSPGPAEDAGAIHWGLASDLVCGGLSPTMYSKLGDYLDRHRIARSGYRNSAAMIGSRDCVANGSCMVSSGSTIPPSSAATAQNRKAGETDFERGWIFGSSKVWSVPWPGHIYREIQTRERAGRDMRAPPVLAHSCSARFRRAAVSPDRYSARSRERNPKRDRHIASGRGAADDRCRGSRGGNPRIRNDTRTRS
jgi:hypothetical protein